MPPVLQKPLKVAVIGQGAREHALARKISESPFCQSLVVIPGNVGMEWDGLECIRPESLDSVAIAEELKTKKIDLVVIGPDDYLADGMTDDLIAKGFKVFGPTKKAAKIEWSKNFAKEVLEKSGVPTAGYFSWNNHEAALAGIEQAAEKFGGYPFVLKYDGLALGKGVQLCYNREEAVSFLSEIYEKKRFKKTTKTETTVICEEFLTGHEVSIFALCDGKDCVILDPVCDHKRLHDGNRGPNTGGMGAFSPVPWLSEDTLKSFKQRIFMPVLNTLNDMGIKYQGLLYAGLMMDGDKPYVLEFNARFGDPETQALLPRMQTDLLILLYSCAVGNLDAGLDQAALRWHKSFAINVVLASAGYPDKPEVGKTIHGLDLFKEKFRNNSQVQLNFAGVKASENERGLVTSGGRVLSVTALGESLELARDSAYSAVSNISFEGQQFRNDIGSLHG